MVQVSIITPAFRAALYLPRAVRSVLAQGFPDWEMLIVADDPQDYRVLLLDEGIADPRLRFLTSGGVGRGPNVTRNVALRHARGTLLAPLDADDLFHPERLERLVPLALEHGMAGDNVRVVDDAGGHELGVLFPPREGIEWLDMAAFVETDVPMSFLFRRELVRAPWDEDVELGADTLFNLRGIEAARRVPVWGLPLHEYRVVAGSVCHARDSGGRAERAYRHCLSRLEETGLGFATAAGVHLARTMLRRKLALNAAFARSHARGECPDFQTFLRRQRAPVPPPRPDLGAARGPSP